MEQLILADRPVARMDCQVLVSVQMSVIAGLAMDGDSSLDEGDDDAVVLCRQLIEHLPRPLHNA
jgi:hypothetical protein